MLYHFSKSRSEEYQIYLFSLSKYKRSKNKVLTHLKQKMLPAECLQSQCYMHTCMNSPVILSPLTMIWKRIIHVNDNFILVKCICLKRSNICIKATHTCSWVFYGKFIKIWVIATPIKSHTETSQISPLNQLSPFAQLNLSHVWFI